MLKNLKQFNLPEIEQKVLEFWREKGIFQKSLNQRKDQKQFVFYEGPPTANAQPGIHHVLGRIFKDIILRYKTMRGYYVPRRAGWDTHGLPVEIEVEKKLGLKSKKDVERYGVAEFNKKCRESVWQYQEEWERNTERIGFWLDLEHPYITYENSYIEKLWGLFKKIWEKKLLYKGYKVVPWCPRCETALSSHELALGYKEVIDQSAYVKFKIKDSRYANTSVLSWTTTLWTLPGNVALAINPRHQFIKVADPENGSHQLILEKTSFERLKKVKTIFTSFKDVNIDGQDLLGLAYEPLFDIQSLRSKNSFKIYPADFVQIGEGTGVVHTAVMYGEDDYQLGLKIGLPRHHTVTPEGKFTDEVSELAGLSVKDKKTEEKIIAYLQDKNFLLKIEPYTHEYPFCWRCGTALLYFANNSWFIKMSALREKLWAANQEINWIPGHLKEGRFGEWLKEAKDWAISRERYWGTPLPIWECDGGNCPELIIGDIQELKLLGGQIPEDLHRPYIDGVILKCPVCGGQMKRIKEVADVWFDSGAMPFASGEYPGRYPADYICEGIDQTRGWFYTLLAIAVLLNEGTPYKNVISLGHLLDKEGKKMSKSKGNTVDPNYLAEKYGVDVIRWYFYTINPPGEPKKFNEMDLTKIKNRFHNLIFNSYVFYETYKLRISETLNFAKLRVSEIQILDRWILARLNETIKSVTKNLDKYEIGEAAKMIESLVDDLSRWYIRRSRKRTEALPVLNSILLEISKLIAPFTPFLAEALFMSILRVYETLNIGSGGARSESVHLENWPSVNENLIDQELLDQMAEIRRLAGLALAKRAEAGIKVRQPLALLRIRNKELGIMENKKLLNILADEINVKEIIFDEKISDEVELDTKLTPELKKEGWLRELTRAVQDLRHEAGYQPSDKIILFIEAPEKHKEWIMGGQFQKDTNAKEILFQKTADFDKEINLKIDDEEIWLAIKKF